MTRELGSKKGVGLLGLMIALVIIGTVAGCTSPTDSAMKAKIQRQQLEARGILQQIFLMEKAYYQRNGYYWLTARAASASKPTAFATLGITLTSYTRYTYFLTSTDAGATNFMGFATCSTLDDDPTQDVWQINDLGDLVVQSDDAAG